VLKFTDLSQAGTISKFRLWVLFCRDAAVSTFLPNFSK